MICKSCGTNNIDSANFCINCGRELKEEKNIEGNRCINCGALNEDDNFYCVQCGTKLRVELKTQKTRKSNGSNNHNKKRKKNKHQHSSFKKQKTLSLKPLFITIGVIIVSIIAVSSFDLVFHKYPKNSEYTTEIKSKDPVFEATVTSIAAKFVCSCGSCNEQSLEICQCPTAIEERGFIRSELKQNKTPDNIVVSLANRYGWLKAEFASQFKVDRSKIWSNNTLVISKTDQSNASLNSTPSDRIATLADRNFIISKFRCPCGQCNINELNDCDCQHPNGATEIKKYITDNILSGTKTVNQIIDDVANKYGGKKI